MHPFVALMRRYCIDYTNSHDQSLYEEIMEPDYAVNTMGLRLVRSTSYAAAVRAIFRSSPGLGLVVHEFVLNGDRLCMHFSEHCAMPTGDGDAPALSCWRGIGLYKWNGRRLTENWVEQDYFALRAQVDSRRPHPLKPPHLDPWVTTAPVPADPASERIVREWLERGHIAAVRGHEIDDARSGARYEPLLEPDEVTINDLFSAGDEVPFHVTLRGRYRGGLGDAAAEHLGRRTTLHVAGIARVEDGAVASVRAVTQRLGALSQLTGQRPRLW